MYPGIKIQPNKYINGGRKEKKINDGGSERPRIGRRHRGLKASRLACFQSWLFSHSKGQECHTCFSLSSKIFHSKKKTVSA